MSRSCPERFPTEGKVSRVWIEQRRTCCGKGGSVGECRVWACGKDAGNARCLVLGNLRREA